VRAHWFEYTGKTDPKDHITFEGAIVCWYHSAQIACKGRRGQLIYLISHDTVFSINWFDQMLDSMGCYDADLLASGR